MTKRILLLKQTGCYLTVTLHASDRRRDCLQSSIGPETWKSWQSNPISLVPSEDLFNGLSVDTQVGWISSLTVNNRFCGGLIPGGN